MEGHIIVMGEQMPPLAPLSYAPVYHKMIKVLIQKNYIINGFLQIKL